MTVIETLKVKNFDNPFTELFSLLKRYEKSSIEFTTLAYQSDELKIINQHVENAIDILMQGLQGIGDLIGTTSQKEHIKVMDQMGFFISAISNLTIALNDLRSDTDYELKQRGIANY